MTPYDPDARRSYLNALPHFTEAHRIMRPLAWASCLYVLCALAAFVVFAVVPIPLSLSGAYGQIRQEGLPGAAIASLLLAAGGLIACTAMAWARHRDAGGGRAGNATVSSAKMFRRAVKWDGLRQGMASWAAGWPQATVILLLAVSAAFCLWRFWPQRVPASAMLSSQSWFALAGATCVLVFPCLIVERYVGAIPAGRLPEVRHLQALLLVPVVALAAEAALLVAAGLGLGWTFWLRIAVALVLLGIAVELAVRTLAVWFLPPPETTAARAAIGSVIATLLRPRSVSPEALAETIRAKLGIDVSRSWAIFFVRRAFVPVLLLMLLFCWFLSGVARIDLNERGVYERFGVAVAVLKPGLHVVLPWPLGLVRHVEYGVLHSVPISYAESEVGAGGTPAALDVSTAEGAPPASANRLWDVAQPADVAYVIASDSAGRQSFATISVSLRVLFQIGLDDDAARRALYRVENPDALVRTLAGRLLAQFFASLTLPSVLGADQASIAHGLQAQLQQELDRLQSGIAIVAVVAEAIHPPSGAAAAYRNVQAAQIAATTDIASERGRAQTTASVAESDARDATDKAKANAAVAVGAARIVLRNLEADEQAYRAAGEPFLLERYLANLKSVLANSSIEIIDHRLADPNAPVIDLRPMAGRAGDGPGYEGKTR